MFHITVNCGLPVSVRKTPDAQKHTNIVKKIFCNTLMCKKWTKTERDSKTHCSNLQRLETPPEVCMVTDALL